LITGRRRSRGADRARSIPGSREGVTAPLRPNTDNGLRTPETDNRNEQRGLDGEGGAARPPFNPRGRNFTL
jgi:hypothetical protein